VEIRWFTTISVIFVNQKADMRVRMEPLPGIGFGITTSKAEIRSVAMISR